MSDYLFSLHIDTAHGNVTSTLDLNEGDDPTGQVTFSPDQGFQYSGRILPAACGTSNVPGLAQFIHYSPVEHFYRLGEPLDATWLIGLSWTLTAQADPGTSAMIDASNTLELLSVSLVDQEGITGTGAVITADSGLNYPFLNSTATVPEPQTWACGALGLAILAGIATGRLSVRR